MHLHSKINNKQNITIEIILQDENGTENKGRQCKNYFDLWVFSQNVFVSEIEQCIALRATPYKKRLDRQCFC